MHLLPICRPSKFTVQFGNPCVSGAYDATHFLHSRQFAHKLHGLTEVSTTKPWAKTQPNSDGNQWAPSRFRVQPRPRHNSYLVRLSGIANDDSEESPVGLPDGTSSRKS